MIESIQTEKIPTPTIETFNLLCNTVGIKVLYDLYGEALQVSQVSMEGNNGLKIFFTSKFSGYVNRKTCFYLHIVKYGEGSLRLVNFLCKNTRVRVYLYGIVYEVKYVEMLRQPVLFAHMRTQEGVMVTGELDMRYPLIVYL